MRIKPDVELIRELADGNKIAFRELYEKYWDKLYIYSFNILKNQTACEDIIQEIFVELWEKRKERRIDTLQAYLFGAVKLKTLNVIRNTAISIKHLGLTKSNQTRNVTEESILYNELKGNIDDVVDQLPEKCRQVFILSRFENLSNKEIAERMDISSQTVKNQITKALAILREKVK